MTVSEVVLVVMTGQDILQRENEKSGTVYVTEQPGQRQAQPASSGGNAGTRACKQSGPGSRRKSWGC